MRNEGPLDERSSFFFHRKRWAKSPVIQQELTMIRSFEGVVFLAAIQADVLRVCEKKKKVWNRSFLHLASYFSSFLLVLSPSLLFSFPLRTVEMDGRSVQESLAELQKCWRGTQPSSSAATPLSVSPWCSLSLCHTRIYTTDSQVHASLGTCPKTCAVMY